MKARIKIDVFFLVLLIALMGFIQFVPKEYLEDPLWDKIFDFLGVIVILKGTLLRMAARGHKKTRSPSGTNLVTTGPYSVTRNPMYLGTFLIGTGFVLVLWPWWSLPLFAIVFYLRFNRQIKTEEQTLSILFGEEFKRYCERTLRIFPSPVKIIKMKTKEIINLQEAADTHEKRGLMAWPVLAFILESLREWMVFGSTNMVETIEIFAAAVFVFAIGFLGFYQWK